MDKRNSDEAEEHKMTGYSATLGSIHPRAHAQQRSAEPRRRTVPSEPPVYGPCNPTPHRSTLHAAFVSLFKTYPGEDGVTLQFRPSSKPRKLRASKVPCTDPRRAPPEPSHNDSRTAGRR